MRLSELCSSVGALTASREGLQFVVGKNFDLITGCSLANCGSCRIRAAAFRTRIPCSRVRRRVYACSDFRLGELADWIPWCRVQRRAYACSDCPLGKLADWIPLC